MGDLIYESQCESIDERRIERVPSPEPSQEELLNALVKALEEIATLKVTGLGDPKKQLEALIIDLKRIAKAAISKTQTIKLNNK